jgi:hypothetical protein
MERTGGELRYTIKVNDVEKCLKYYIGGVSVFMKDHGIRLNDDDIASITQPTKFRAMKETSDAHSVCYSYETIEIIPLGVLPPGQ